MGGAAGHIKQIWENHEFTFKELKELIIKLLTNKIPNIFEKLDGINILITYKNNKILIARSTKHLKNFGIDALDFDNLKKYLNQRNTNECAKKAFIETVNDFQNVFNKSKLNINNIFQEGKRWFNVEILYKETENIIPYEKNQLRIHYIKEIDKEGKTICLIRDSEEFNALISEIRQIQLDLNNTFYIDKTNEVFIKEVDNNILTEFVKNLQNIRDSVDLKDTNTIEDYIEIKIKEFINQNIKISDEFLNLLSNRWAKNDKTVHINFLLKDQDEFVVNWVKTKDKIIKDKIDEILEPIVDLFCNFGIFILNNLEGVTTNDKNKSINKIKDKLNISIEYINKLNSIGDKFLLAYLKKIKRLGGLKTITPLEGIVFSYNDNLLKLTGCFTCILRIIGFYMMERKTYKSLVDI